MENIDYQYGIYPGLLTKGQNDRWYVLPLRPYFDKNEIRALDVNEDVEKLLNYNKVIKLIEDLKEAQQSEDHTEILYLVREFLGPFSH